MITRGQDVRSAVLAPALTNGGFEKDPADNAIFTFHDNSYLTDGIDLVFDNVRLVPVSP
ncbi:MAG: hypothetical protein KDN05_13230 [Verrucomicrobiae bacterium]|nr:hypothetical protein [Verrucomicrobiae bacterium]